MSFLIWFFAALVVVFLLNQSFQLNDRFRLFQPQDEKPNMPPVILYPSIGCPLEIMADQPGPFVFKVYLTVTPTEAARELTAAVRNVSATGAPWSVNVKVVQTRSISATEVSIPGTFSDWVLKNFDHLTELTLQWEDPPDPGIRRNLLFDLVITIDSLESLKESCLFVSKKSPSKTVLQATDIHVSRRWDIIDEEYKAHFTAERTLSGNPEKDVIFTSDDLYSYEAFHNSFSNPNTNFISLIRKANQLHRQGKLDFILATGDLVDFKFQAQKKDCSQSFGESEWDIFLKILAGKYPGSERLEVPVYTMTGNHDYRLYPYRLQVYGLQHCGVPDDMLEAYLRKTGQYSAVKYHLYDADAVRINDGQNHSLSYYYQLINPFNDYFLDVDNNRFIFLDSKSDAFCHFSNFLSSKVFTLFSNIEHPSSDGIYDSQFRFFEAVADSSKNITLLCHAPLLNSPAPPNFDAPGPGTRIFFPDITDARAGKFEKELFRADLSLSVIFHNQFAILRNLIGNPNSTVVLSGHNHRNDELCLDKSSHELFRGRCFDTFQQDGEAENKVFFLQTPSLGHVQRSEQEKVEPSCRIIEYDQGRMVSSSVLPVAEKPFDLVSSHIVFSETGGKKTVEVTVSPVHDPAAVPGSLTNWFLVTCQAGGDEPAAIAPKILSTDDARLLHEQPETGFRYWVYEMNNGFLKLEMPELPKDLHYEFSIRTMYRSSDGVLHQRLRRFYQSL